MAGESSVSGSPTAGGGKSVSFNNHQSEDAGSTRRNAWLGAALPAPALLSRSHSSIELLPFLFAPPSPLSREEESKDGLTVATVGVVAQTALSASNATSTTATVSRHGGGKPTRKKQKVAKVQSDTWFRRCSTSHVIVPQPAPFSTFRNWRALLATQYHRPRN